MKSRSLARGVAALAILIVPQVIALHVAMHLGGPGLHPKSILNTLRQVTPKLVLVLALGLAARAVYELWRRRLRIYLRGVATPGWLAGSAALVLSAALTVHTYAYLKLLVPLVHPATYDQVLWKLDRWLLFGLSPNVFFLTLFSEPPLLRALDWSYARLFYPVLVGFLLFFLSLRSNRLRFAIASGFAALWLAGAWLYVLLPALGPCYPFSKLWETSVEFMPIAHTTQVWLMDNYTKVLRIPEGMLQSEINAALGIAAFPSLHLGSQLYVALWVRRLAPWLGFALFLTVGVMFVGSVVTGWHYMIDSVAGVLMGWIAYRVSARAWGLEGWRQQSDLQPAAGRSWRRRINAS